MPVKHYKFGGSTAARTINCPAWQPLADELPNRPDGSSPDADRGTLLHDCMEVLLKDPELPYSALLGNTYKDQTVTEEDIHEAIMPAMEAYQQFADEHDVEIEMPEITMQVSEQMGGTADVLASNTDTVFVIDWKFGYHPVSAQENAQGLFYAMCARKDPTTSSLFEGKTKLCVVIVQPTTDETISYWFTDIARLNAFVEDYTEAVDSQDINNPITGDHCKFCPAMAVCPAKTGQARAALMMQPDSDQLTVLLDALNIADDVIAWAHSVKKLAHEQAELGTALKGWKLVDKRATRKWTHPDEVMDIVRKAKKLKLEEAVDMKLKTPPQLEKVCKKKGIDFNKYAAYIEKVSSGTTLTTADDPRPEAFNVDAFADAIARTE